LTVNLVLYARASQRKEKASYTRSPGSCPQCLGRVPAKGRSSGPRYV